MRLCALALALAADGMLRSSESLDDLLPSQSGVGYCGSAFDSTGRPVIAGNDTIIRLVR
jgi:hypothetical protein